MNKITKIKVSSGIDWIQIDEVDLRLLCGCPADAVKHLFAKGLIRNYEEKGVSFESGPNAILLSDIAVQNGQFSNLGEFPVLQMLYRQGMIIPGHPNNTGQKPQLIGNQEQLEAQLEYIYRGNYGLIDIEEMVMAGLSQEEAHDLLRMKKKFAFGEFISPNEIFQLTALIKGKNEIKPGVYLERIGVNQFEISYKGEKVKINLNLQADESYIPTYDLGFRKIKRNHFSVIHSGDGDGWDIHQPCMASIISYNSDIYLIDAGPNIMSTLNALGISISEVKGIFHTHCHDDHFNGLTALIKADHKLHYFAHPMVRESVGKKLSALMSTQEDILSKYFLINDLPFNEWTNIEGLEVQPIFSPHPVETTNFRFRVIADGGYKSYFHMADTSSFAVLDGMLTADDNAPGISAASLQKVKDEYLLPADIKKVDIGGGMIHGMAVDFKEDKSGKIILSHTSKTLTPEEKIIGSKASFGLEEILIESNINPIIRYAKNYLTSYFNMVDPVELEGLLNCPLVFFNAGEVIAKKGGSTEYLYLSLTGNVEIISEEDSYHHIASAGTFIGEMAALLQEKRKKTYIAASYVWASKIPANMYQDFVKKHNLMDEILNSRTNRAYLRSSMVFENIHSSAVFHDLSTKLKCVHAKKGSSFNEHEGDQLAFLIKGEMELQRNGKVLETIYPGDICGESGVITEEDEEDQYIVHVKEDSIYGVIPGKEIRKIPSIMWIVLEIHQRRKVL